MTVTIKHSVVTNAPANPEVLVDGPAWDAVHVVTGLATSATTDTTNASNITSGTLPAAQLPAPTSTTLGGVKSLAATTHQFLTSIGADGGPVAAQPAAGDISGLAASATTDTTNASNITSGTLPSARIGSLPAGVFANPSATIGLAANNGTATTSARSDATPALSQAIAPTWTGLHTFTATAGGIQISGSPGITQSFSGQTAKFGLYNSLTAALSSEAEVAGFDGITSSTGASSVVTVSIASPAVITLANHNLPVGAQIVFATTGALPTGLVAGTTYYLSTTGNTANSFQVADTLAHAQAGTNSINTSGTQSGVQSINTTTLAYKMARAFTTTVNSGSGSGWVLNPVVNIGAGGTIRGGIGLEVDLNNSWGNYTGSPSNPYACNYVATGTNTGGYSSFAFGAEFGGNASPMWQTGYHGGPAGFNPFNTAFIWDESNSPTILLASGSHTHGVDLSSATFTGKAFRSPGFLIDNAGNLDVNNLVVHSFSYLNPLAGNLIERAGSLDIWQRGAGSSASIAVAASTTAYTADGWYLITNASQASVVSAQAGIATGSQLAAKIIRNSAQTGTGVMRFAMPLDTDEVARAAGNFVALSFTAKAGANWSPTSGTLSFVVFAGTGAVGKRGASAYTSETSVISSTVNISTTAGRTTITSAAIVPAATTQMEVQFNWTPVGTAGADDSVTIDDVQLERVVHSASGASPFKSIPFLQQLALCQRHFWKTFPYATAPAQNAGRVGAAEGPQFVGAAATQIVYLFRHPVKMRAIPTLTTYNPSAANAQVRNASAGSDWTGTTIDPTSTSEDQSTLVATSAAGSATGQTFTVHLSADAGI